MRKKMNTHTHTPPRLDDRMFHKQDCYLSASDAVAKAISLAVLLHLHRLYRTEMPNRHKQRCFDQLGRAAVPSVTNKISSTCTVICPLALFPDFLIILDFITCSICSWHVPICCLGNCLSTWCGLVLFSWCGHKRPFGACVRAWDLTAERCCLSLLWFCG